MTRSLDQQAIEELAFFIGQDNPEPLRKTLVLAKLQLAQRTEAVAVLEELWQWVTNWNARFLDDDEFPATRKRIENVLIES